MDNNTNQARRATSFLRLFAALYMVFATAFLLAYFWRFRGAPISEVPADWAGFAQMIGALVGLPLALWSIALVLRSVQLQQEQISIQQRLHNELLERENTALDPEIKGASPTESPHWTEEGDERVFRLTVHGTARWMTSTCPGGPSLLIGTDSNGVDVVMWPVEAGSGRYRAFLSYQRANGSTGWYWVAVIPPEKGRSGQHSFVAKVASGPTEAEDGIQVQVLD